MNVQEFHAHRRMFIVKDGTVFVAPEGYPDTHVEWLMRFFDPGLALLWIKEYVRGYVLGSRLVAYVGETFAHRVNHKDVLAALAVMEKMYPIEEIGLGAVPGQDQPWEPRVVMPKEEYRQRIQK